MVKEVAYTSRADAHIQLHKVGAGDGQELNVRLAGDGLGKQGLAGPRRAYEKYALGYARAHGGIRLGVLEEIDDLLKLFLLLVAARDVGKGLFVLLVGAEACARLAELGNTACAAARSVHHDVPEYHRDGHYEEIRQEAHPPRDDEALGIIELLKHAGVILLHDEVAEVLIEHGEAVQAVGLFHGRLHRVAGAHLEDDVAALRDEGLHLFILEKIDQLGIALHPVGGGVSCHGEDYRDEYHHQKRVKAKISCPVSVRFQTLFTSLMPQHCIYEVICRSISRA